MVIGLKTSSPPMYDLVVMFSSGFVHLTSSLAELHVGATDRGKWTSMVVSLLVLDRARRRAATCCADCLWE